MAELALVIGTIGAATASGFGVTIAATSTAAVVIGTVVIGAGVATLLTRQKRPSFAFSDDAGQLINQNANDARLPLVYGQRQVGATRIFIRAVGPHGETDRQDYAHVVYAIAEGPIQAFTEIRFQDSVIYKEAAYGTTTVEGFNEQGIVTNPDDTSRDHSQNLEIHTFHGWETGLANPLLVGRFPNEWSTDHLGKGVAYIYIRYKWNQRLYPGLPPNVISYIQGKRVRDIFNLDNGVFYSTNPADVLYDYLTNTVYGRGFSADIIDIESFKAAHLYYDEQHPFLGEARYTMNGALSTGQTTYENVHQILACCNSALVFTNGKHRLIPFKTEPVSHIIRNEDVNDNWEYIVSDKTSLYNTIDVTFTNKDDNYQRGNVVVVNDEAKRQDGGIELKQDITLELVVDPNRAKILAHHIILQSRHQKIIQIRLPHTRMNIEPMDIIDFDLSDQPENFRRLYRVMSIVLEPNGELLLTGVEYSPDVYIDVDPTTL